MNFKNLATGAALVLGIALLGLPAAHADLILTYTGNDFTFAIPPYTDTDNVTASITLAAPLGDNQNSVNVTPIAFSLTDGVRTIDNNTPPMTTAFIFSTDAVGMITEWEVFASVGDINNRIETLDLGGDRVFDSTILTQSIIAGNTASPGRWTAPLTATPTPEPATVTVLGAGLLGLVLLRRRRRHNLDL
jgi:hypothetical protein